MSVSDRDVTVIDVVDENGWMVMFVSVRNISAVIGDEIARNREDIGPKEGGICDVSRRAERSE